MKSGGWLIQAMGAVLFQVAKMPPPNLGNLSKDVEATVLDPQGDLELWDTAQNQVTARVILPANTLRRSRLGSELVLARQTNLFFATTNGTIQNWSLPKGQPAQSISLEAGLVSLIGVSPD